MVRQAREVVVVADSSKIGMTSRAVISGSQKITYSLRIIEFPETPGRNLSVTACGYSSLVYRLSFACVSS